MCFGPVQSFTAFGTIVVVTLYLYFYKGTYYYKNTTRMLIQCFWALMELLQYLGYVYPSNASIAYGLILHSYFQPLVLLTSTIYATDNSLSLKKYYLVYSACIITVALNIVSLFSKTLATPCIDVFCSLNNDTTPRCVTENVVHMTWSVPRGYVLGMSYLTPTFFTHFLFSFIIPALINLKMSLLVISIPVFMNYLFWDSSKDMIVNESVIASIWCYVGLFLGCGVYPLFEKVFNKNKLN
jgi:hypothetical protein